MLDIKNLYFTYNKSRPFLICDLNMNINKGDYVSILGDNGSGKSTLVKLMLKFLKPSKGEIHLKTKQIGYVPQRFESMNSQFPITVFEALNCHRKAIGVKDPKSVILSLQMVGMEKFSNSLMGNLSGGQQQKIFIARALMGTPEILIFDEPSTGVDVQSQDEIYSIIKHLNVAHGITVIAIEHNLKAALSNSNYIFSLSNGSGTMLTIDEYKSRHRRVQRNAAV